MTFSIPPSFVAHVAQQVRAAYAADAVGRPGPQMTATEILRRRAEMNASWHHATFSTELNQWRDYGPEGPGLTSWMRVKDDWTDMYAFMARCRKYDFESSVPGWELSERGMRYATFKRDGDITIHQRGD